MANRVTRLFHFWFTLNGAVDRRSYLATGVALMIVKYLGDAWLVWRATGIHWEPEDYLLHVHSLLTLALPGAPSWLLPVLALWALPFIWIGVSLSLRRTIDAGLSPWLTVVFFIPFVNFVLMLILVIAPALRARRTQAPRIRVLPGWATPGGRSTGHRRRFAACGSRLRFQHAAGETVRGSDDLRHALCHGRAGRFSFQPQTSRRSHGHDQAEHVPVHLYGWRLPALRIRRRRLHSYGLSHCFHSRFARRIFRKSRGALRTARDATRDFRYACPARLYRARATAHDRKDFARSEIFGRKSTRRLTACGTTSSHSAPSRRRPIGFRAWAWHIPSPRISKARARALCATAYFQRARSSNRLRRGNRQDASRSTWRVHPIRCAS